MNVSIQHSPASSSPWPHVAGAVLGLTALLSLLVAAFAWPASQLEPRDLPIAIAGPPAVVQPIEQALARGLGEDTFDVSAVGSRKAAVEAIEGREAYGAIVVSPAGAEMLTTSAASPVAAQALGQVAASMSAAAPPGTPPINVTDVVPAPADDPRGAVFGAGSLPLVLGGIATAALLGLRIERRSGQVAGAAGVALGAGFAIAAILQYWLGALDGSYLANASVMALGIGAIALFVLACRNVLGPAGLGLGAATILLLGNPFSGITSAPEMLPGGWSTIGQWMPPGAVGQALRSTAFFDGAGVSMPLVVLGLWLTGGLALMAVRGRRTAAEVSERAERRHFPGAVDASPAA